MNDALQKKGFTLLEMLIVLGIIAILLSVMTISFSAAQKKTRDAKRKSDLKMIQNAFEQYYAICGYSYPTSLGTSVACGASPAIISVIPVDPQKGTEYAFTSLDSGAGFSICTNYLESESPANYCVYNQQ